MTRAIRVAINGAAGRMGVALCALLARDTRFALRHAVVAPGSACIGAPVFPAAADTIRFAAGWHDAPELDVVIDFSTPAALDTALAHCLASGTALVTGTTGSVVAMDERLVAAGTRIAVLRAANFSLGVAVLTRLLRDAAAALPAWDVEIVEMHHGAKRDAPSGTALALGRAAARARGAGVETPFVLSREGLTNGRTEGSIGFAAVRGGDIVGEHTALLIGQGERLELVHRAADRSIFARGALHAAHWLSQRASGVWTLDDMLAAPPAGT
ncbi:MAG TPA: 4-hydroxy-tetrahydrodipicolinate reductase [Rhodanobacter sp.]|nr:4-hydroxy-tetrahydrodipicolinate reductase [Rhodanobacter sp.]